MLAFLSGDFDPDVFRELPKKTINDTIINLMEAYHYTLKRSYQGFDKNNA